MVRIVSGKRSKNIVTIALVTACCLLGDSMLYIALPIYWREAGLDGLWQVGILLAVNRFVRLPLNPIVGKIYGKISLKAGLMFAVFLSIITTVGYGFAGIFGTIEAVMIISCTVVIGIAAEMFELRIVYAAGSFLFLVLGFIIIAAAADQRKLFYYENVENE